MLVYIMLGLIAVGSGMYMYRAYQEYTLENTEKAQPLAEQIELFLQDYKVDVSQRKTRVKRVDVYDDFASMYTIKQNGQMWDFYIVNKKTATDPTKCIRLHLGFYCKNANKIAWTLKPKEDLAQGASFEEAFELESAFTDVLTTFFDQETQERLLEIVEHNKGVWRLQQKNIVYDEPIEIDTDEKRLQVREIIDLGLEMAEKVNKL